MIAGAYKTCPGCVQRTAADSRFCSHCGYDVSEVEPDVGDPYEGLILADKYVIEGLIGEGAMGRVYQARQLTLGKTFAAKILAPHLLNDEASHARFASEAHNAASLSHPNCVSVVDYGQTPDGITYIVMEHVKGNTLESIIIESFPLPRARIVDLTLQILAALTEAHGMGILHRDLKPENILVQKLRTRGELAKVLDFGIAKLMADKSQAGTGLTTQGMVCGTPEYMSPEQARGDRLDQRSDLYAVGCILYQMLTGRPPFESVSAIDLLHQHLHSTPVPPHELMGIDAEPLEAVCLRALEKQPDARFESASEFREALVRASAEPESALTPCAHCGAPMRADHRFCPACGAEAHPVASAPPTLRPTQRGIGHAPQPIMPTAEVLARRLPLPLRGREHVLERFHAALNAAQAGVSLHVIVGATGTGKTRITEEVAHAAEQRGWHTFRVGPDPSDAQTPLWPIRAMVAQLLEVDAGRLTTADLGKISNMVGLPFEMLPGIAELFGLHGPAYDLEVRVRRRECFASAQQALVHRAIDSPTVLVFDDVDRFDTPSRQVLECLSKTWSDGCVVVVCTSSERNVGWLCGEVHNLGPLSREQVESALNERTVDINRDSSLPHTLSELAPMTPRALESRLRLSVAGHAPIAFASDTELTLQQVALLTEAAQRLLECGAVLGQRFATQDAFALLQASAFRCTETISDIVDELLASGLVLADSSSTRFQHAAAHELVYNRIPIARRRALHRIALQERLVGSSQVVRALHRLRAGVQDAYLDLAEASRQAERAFDDPAATEFIRAAFHELDKHALEELPLEVALCEMAARVMRSHEASLACARLIESRLARHEFPPQDQAKLLTCLGQLQGRYNDHPRARITLQRALAPAMAAGDRRAMAAAYEELGRTYADANDFSRALTELNEGLDMFTLGEGPRADLEFPIWRYLLRMCDCCRCADALTQARAWCEHALAHATRAHHRLGILRSQATMAWVLRDLNQLALAEQHLARALDEARALGDRLTTAQLLLERARARVARGRVEDARRCCNEARKLAREIHWEAGVTCAQRTLAMLTPREDEPVQPAREPVRVVAQS